LTYEIAMSRRIYVTLPDTVYADLKVWAGEQGRPTANLAAFLVELGIRDAKQKGEFKTRKSVDPKSNGQI
jgi:hypothetical protein